MRIITKYTNLVSTAAIEEYAREKIGALAKFVKRYDPVRGKSPEATAAAQLRASNGVAARVELARTTKHHRKGDVFYAEITLRLPGKTLRAEDEDFDLRVAIDRCRDKMKREIEKYKTR